MNELRELRQTTISLDHYRVVGFILDPAAIRKILQHRPRLETRAHAPPAG